MLKGGRSKSFMSARRPAGPRMMKRLPATWGNSRNTLNQPLSSGNHPTERETSLAKANRNETDVGIFHISRPCACLGRILRHGNQSVGTAALESTFPPLHFSISLQPPVPATLGVDLAGVIQLAECQLPKQILHSHLVGSSLFWLV